MSHINEQLVKFFGGARFIDAISRRINSHSLVGVSEERIAKECSFGMTCPYFDFVFIDESDRDFWVEAIKKINVVQTTISVCGRWDISLDEPRSTRLYRVIITTHEVKKLLGEDKSRGRVVVFATDHLKDRSARQGFWENYIREWVRSNVSRMIV